MSNETALLTEQTDPYCLSVETGAELLAAAPWRRFGVVGDSLSADTGDQAEFLQIRQTPTGC